MERLSLVRVFIAILPILCVFPASLHGQTLYWTQPSGVYRKTLPSGITDPLILKNKQPYARGVAVDSDNEWLYWASAWPHAIERSNLDGTHAVTVIEFETHPPNGIAIDVQGGKMYIARGFLVTPGRIQRANLDGSSLEDLVVADAPAPSDVALDIANGKMYWTDWSLDVVRRANLDGSNMETLVSGGLTAPHAIALDLIHGKMYWTDPASSQISPGKVEYANLDGTDRASIHSAMGIRPLGVTVDPTGGKVYWMDDRFGQKAVYTADLDGSNRGVLFPIDDGFVWGIDFDASANRVYWPNPGNTTIFATDADTGVTVDLFPNEIEDPLTMKIDRAHRDLYWTDLDRIRRATTEGANIVTIPGIQTQTALAVDVSTARVYSVVQDGGEKLVRGTLGGEVVEVLYELPSFTFGESGAAAIDLLHGYVFLSYIEYPFYGTIRRSDLDGGNPVDMVVVEERVDRLGGLSVDVLNEKLYWWVSVRNLQGNYTDLLYRANLDGSNAVIITEVKGISGVKGTPSYGPSSVVVAPWEQALYISNRAASAIQRADLDATTFETVADADAFGLDVDPCTPTSVSSSEPVGYFVDCVRGPASPLPGGCSCADFTAEGLIDLRDVSAFMLSWGR